MLVAVAACLSLAIAAIIAWFELITSKYPRTGFLIRWNPYLWGYATIYGGLAFCMFLAVENGFAGVRIDGVGGSSVIMRGIIVGLCAKAFLHIRLFNVTAGTKQFPVGTETFVQIFEPWVLREVELAEFNRVREFVTAHAIHYPNEDSVKEAIEENIPPTIFTSGERTAFLRLLRTATAVEAMEHCLRNFGRKTVDRLFPPRGPEAPPEGPNEPPSVPHQ